jgi:hypothetical protein
MKKYILAFTALTLIGITYSALNKQMDAISNAAGAPGGSSCAVSGCHSSPVQSSNDVLVKVLDDQNEVVTTYTAGKTYTVEVSSVLSNQRFGFALTASSGSLTSGDGSQKVSNYVTHTFAGTNPNQGGGKTWVLEWTAPNSGIVSFQLYLNASNNDGSNTGDVIYGHSLTLSPVTGINDIVNEQSLSVYPNPIVDALNITFELSKPSQVIVNVMDLHGKVIKHVTNAKLNSGMQHIHVANNLPQGLYFVEIQAGEQVITKKIMVN